MRFCHPLGDQRKKEHWHAQATPAHRRAGGHGRRLRRRPPGIAKAAVYNEWQTEDGLCMGVMGGNMTPGTAIITWACDGTSNQFWEFDTNSGAPDTFLLRNSANPSECLSVFQKAMYVGAPLVIWPCKGFDDNQDQRWSRSDFPSAPIYNFNSGLQIRPSGPQGSAVVQWDLGTLYFWTDTDFVFV